MSVTNRKMPVFVLPSSLEFYLPLRESHRQFLTIHNPYDFPINFTITCTDPSKYNVKIPEGSIGPNSLVDIGIRHIMPALENCGLVDKFKINMMDQQMRQMGFKVVEAVLLDCVKKDDSDSHGDIHKSYEANATTSDRQNRHIVTPSSFYLFLFIGICAVIIICLPTSIESIEVPNSSLPMYLHMSLEIKLFCAFLVGMITQILIKIV